MTVGLLFQIKRKAITSVKPKNKLRSLSRSILKSRTREVSRSLKNKSLSQRKSKLNYSVYFRNKSINKKSRDNSVKKGFAKKKNLSRQLFKQKRKCETKSLRSRSNLTNKKLRYKSIKMAENFSINLSSHKNIGALNKKNRGSRLGVKSSLSSKPTQKNIRKSIVETVKLKRSRSNRKKSNDFKHCFQSKRKLAFSKVSLARFSDWVWFSRKKRMSRGSPSVKSTQNT